MDRNASFSGNVALFRNETNVNFLPRKFRPDALRYTTAKSMLPPNQEKEDHWVKDMIANLAGFLPSEEEIRPPQLAASFISRRRNVDVWHVSDVPLLPTKVLTQMLESHFSPAGIPLAG
jgi:hypothetical protein